MTLATDLVESLEVNVCFTHVFSPIAEPWGQMGGIVNVHCPSRYVVGGILMCCFLFVS